jgi:hypothetical protein
MGRCVIPYQKNEILIKHFTQRLEIAFHFHCSFTGKDLVKPFTSGVNNTSQKVFNFILSRRGDSVLFIDELIALANVSTPMDFGFIIVDHHCLLGPNHWYDAGGNYLYIIGG